MGLPPRRSAEGIAEAAIQARGSGSPVDPRVRGKVEGELGANLSGVRVHTDAGSAAAADELGAAAFTYREDVFLGAGQSPTDLPLMAHELTHVAQQGAATQPALQRKATLGAPDHPAEHEADAVAAKVAAGGTMAWVVPDEQQPTSGQLRRTDFLAMLHTAVIAAATDALGPAWSLAGCPYIERWFAEHATTDAATLERLVRRFSGQAGAGSAADYVAPLCARLRAGITRWRAGEDMSAELADAGMSEAAGAASAAVSGAPDKHPGATGGATDASGAKAAAGGDVQTKMLAAPEAAPSGGSALDAGVAAAVGDAYGEDFSGVRVHTGPDAAAMTARRGAAAVTVGDDITFAPGRYQPGTPHGDALLAHELAHVAQQRGAAPVPQDKLEEHAPGDAHEIEADRAAEAAVARIHGGVKGRQVKPQLKTSRSLQLTSCTGSSPKFTDPFVLALKAKLEATPPDKTGFFNDLRTQAGAKAGDAPLRAGLDWFRGEGYITDAEVFRAVALTELGAEASWPDVVKNYADGVDKGLFPVKSGLPPTGKDALIEYCVLGAGEKAAAPGDAMAEYRRRFDAKWQIAPYAALDTAFAPGKDSKGPRTVKARRIFDDLYTDPAIKKAYDDDTPRGFRAQCDSYLIPEGVNNIASPRLEELRLALAAAATATAVTGTTDPVYTAIVTAVTPKATALDGKDRAHIEQQHEWRTVVEQTVKGTDAAVSETVRSDLWNVITNSRPAVPVGPAPLPPPALPPPVLSKAHKDFLASITMSATTPQDASTDRHPVKFTIKSGKPNPALAVSRRVTVEPAANVVDGSEDESPWPDKASAMDHTAHVNPEVPPPGPLKVTAKLNMPPVTAADFAEKKFDVDLNDKRLDWFKANITHGISVFDEQKMIAAVSGTRTPYHGGQLPIMVVPELSGGNNPGLNLSIDGEVKKLGGATIAIVRKRFPTHGNSAPLGATGAADAGPYISLLEPTPPPAPGSPDKYEITLRVFQGPGAGVLVHTLPVLKLEATAGLPPVAGGDAKVLADDTAELNKPIATPGSFLAEMKSTATPGSIQDRMADAIAGGAVKVQAMIIRSDSAAWLKAQGLDEKRFVAWAHGMVDDAHTSKGDPDVVGRFRWAFPDTVYVAVTQNVHTKQKNSRADLFGFISHEGIHAADKIPATVTTFERYKREFRAYWIEGTGQGKPEGFDPTITGNGPKSPRANAIFQKLYDTYSYVKPDYDTNKDGMRDQVDRYFYPDGINLTLSPKLADLRREIESYTGAGYAAKKAAVTTKFGACSADDKKEIHNNRAWRDLVEETFTNKVEAGEIKGILVIPT